MKDILEAATPQVTNIVVAIIGLIATVVLSMLALLQKRFIVWLNSKTSINDRELIYRVANEAFSLAETAFKESASQAKMNFAFSYASDILAKAGIKVTNDEIKSAIEKAVLEYNMKKTP